MNKAQLVTKIAEKTNFTKKDSEKVLKATIESIVEALTEGTPVLYCDCSRDRVEKAFISIGEEELTKLYDENKEEELVCHFCNKKYNFTHVDIGNLLQEIRKH